MPDNSKQPDYLSKVPKSNKERESLNNSQILWVNAQLTKSPEEKQKQREENYRKILESYYQFLTSFGEVGIDLNPKSTTYGYNLLTAYWEMKENLKILTEKGRFDKFLTLESNFKDYCNSIFFHDFIDHLDNGNESRRKISDWLNWISENKLNGYDQNDGEKNEFLLVKTFSINLENENNATFFKKEIIDLLTFNQKDKIIRILSQKFENSNRRNEFLKIELGKPENLAILKNMANLFCRTQVFRGILSLIYKPFNLKKLEFAHAGLPIEIDQNPILKVLQKELMEKVDKLNILMQKFPEKFDNYEVFLIEFGKDFSLKTVDENGESLKGEEFLDQMRMEMTESYRKIMDDKLAEKLARQILEKN